MARLHGRGGHAEERRRRRRRARPRMRLEAEAKHVRARIAREVRQQRQQRPRVPHRRRGADHQVQHAVGVHIEAAHQALQLARLQARPAVGASAVHIAQRTPGMLKPSTA